VAPHSARFQVLAAAVLRVTLATEAAAGTLLELWVIRGVRALRAGVAAAAVLVALPAITAVVVVALEY